MLHKEVEQPDNQEENVLMHNLFGIIPSKEWRAKHCMMFRTNENGYRADLLYAVLTAWIALGFAVGMIIANHADQQSAVVMCLVGALMSMAWSFQASRIADKKILTALNPAHAQTCRICS